MRKIFGLIFRVVLLLAGLVFLASLLLAAVLLLGLWLLRAVWAKLTGQPVSPWAFQFDRQAMVNRFYRSSGQGATSSRRDAPDIVDVEIKEVTEIREIKPPQ